MSFRLDKILFCLGLLFVQCNHPTPANYKESIEIISYSPSISFPTILNCGEFRRETEINDYGQIIEDTIIFDKIFFNKIKSQFVEGRKNITKSSDIDVKVLVKINHECKIDSFFLALGNKIIVCEEGYFESEILWTEIQSVRNTMHSIK